MNDILDFALGSSTVEYILTNYRDMIRAYLEEYRATGKRPEWIDEKIIAETGCETWHLVEAHFAVNEEVFGGENPYLAEHPQNKIGPKPFNTSGADDSAILKFQENYLEI